MTKQEKLMQLNGIKSMNKPSESNDTSELQKQVDELTKKLNALTKGIQTGMNQ